MSLLGDSLYATNPEYRDMVDLEERLSILFGQEAFAKMLPSPPPRANEQGESWMKQRQRQLAEFVKTLD